MLIKIRGVWGGGGGLNCMRCKSPAVELSGMPPLQEPRVGGWGGYANGTPCHIQHSPNTPTTGLRERGNDTSKSTGRSGRQKVATRRNMRREERVTVQGPVKEQQPDGMSHRGAAPMFWGLGSVVPLRA